MKYKDELYSTYVRTHINPRKASGSVDEFRRKAKSFDSVFGKFLPQNHDAKILDMGCGPGNIVWWLQSHGYVNAYGVDYSPEQVDIAHEIGLKSVSQGDVFDYLESSEQDYSVLIGRDILEHLDKDAAYRLLKLSYSKLKRGGKLIIQVPNAESPLFGRVRYGDFTHEIAFTASSISQICLSAGFSTVNVYPVRPVVTGIRSAYRRFFWFFVELFIKWIVRLESPGAGKVVTTNLIAIVIK